MRPSQRRHAQPHRSPRHRPPPRPARPARRGGAAAKVGWTVAVAAALAAGGVMLTSHTGRPTTSLTSNSSSMPLFGTSVAQAGHQFQQNTAEYGHLPIVRLYYSGLPSANAWTTGVPAQAKSAEIISFNANPSAILSGADDGVLSHFFDTAPTGHLIYYSFVHEPEKEIKEGQFTVAAYKAAWAHVVALADRAHNPDLRSTLILMSYDLKKYAHRNWHDYMPGGGIISTLAFDAYPNGGRQAESPAQFMGPAVAAAKSSGLPWGFAEFGMSTSVGRAAWLKEVGDYLMTSGAQFGTMFDSNNVRPTMLVSDQASIDAWRPFVQDSDRNVGASAPAPAPAPAKKVPAKKVPARQHAARHPAAVTARMSLSRARVGAGGRFAVRLRLAQAANVTICVLGRNGAVTAQLARPNVQAGVTRITDRAPAGAGGYRVLVVASNAQGSTVLERPLLVR